MNVTIIGTIFILFAIYSLASSAGIFAERSGTINLSIDGTMIFSAIGYIMFANTIADGGKFEPWMAAISGILGIMLGMLFNTLLSFAAINLRGNQVVIGTALNIFAPIISLVIVILLTNGQYSVPNVYQTAEFTSSGIEGYVIQIIVALIALVILAFVAYIMKYTVLGLRIRAAGENPHALDSAGVSVKKIRHIAMLFSGALAGLAGVFAIMCYDRFSSYNNSILGMGFIAIAILIIGQWKIIWATVGSLLFALIYSIVDQYSLQVDNYQWLIYIVPYVAAIIFLPALAKYARAPKAAGIPYVNTGR